MDQKLYEMVKTQVLKETEGMRKVNQEIPVTGERIDLPMTDRKINIVFFRAKSENAPLILGFHGGGFLFGGNALNDPQWSAVRDRLDVNIASVEYRKSPDYMWKAALDDAYDAAIYLKEHASEFGFDANRISVMGCSAGACLSATLCIYAKKMGGITFQNQVLMYPFLDAATDPDSKGEGSISGPIMYIFNDLHCTPEDARLPEVSPVFAKPEEMEGLPNAIFCMADNDCLKAEGYQYAEMLKEAGVPTAVTECKGMPHGFFESGFGEISEQERAFLGEEVIAMIKSGEIARASEEALEFVAEHFVF